VPGQRIERQDSSVDERDPLDFLELDLDGELVGARVVGARCAGFAFTRARLSDVELVRCDLAGCDFSEANFQRVRLVDCRCIGIELGGATWRTVTAVDCRLDDANLRLTQLKQVRFEASVCARSDFGGARLEDVAFPDSDLAGADLSNAKCKNVDLRRARLDGLKGIGSLRGATIGVEQLFGLAPGLATAVGLRVVAADDPA
jgi:uncharacterized protein YjbI with pentapeptide repeats